MKFWAAVLCVTLMLGGVDAEAKRLGGSRSLGKQSSNVTQRAAPTAPAQNAAAPAAPAPTPVATPARKPWGAMLGGLAAGLGLAWLANSLGLGAAFGQFLLIALLVLGAMVLIGLLRRPARERQTYAFQGAGAAGEAVTPRSYRPENVGNDASARPFERGNLAAPAPGTAGG